jgi:protein-disulfide isomerase
MRQIALLSVALLSFCVVLPAQARKPARPKSIPTVASGKSALDKATFEQYIRHLFAWGSQIQVTVQDPKPGPLPGFQQVTIVATAGQASQEETFLVSNDGKNIIRGVAYNVDENPFSTELSRINTDGQPSFGDPGAPVNAVIYSDFQCSFCREEAKTIRQSLAPAYPAQVRVYFKDYPLEAIHPWAKRAAIAGRCVFRQKPEAFWEFHDWIFENQPQITVENLKDKVMEFAKSKGLETVQLGGCIDSKATEAEVDRSIAEARALGVNSTPTIFVNGRRLVGQHPWPQLKSLIDHEIEYHGCIARLPGLRRTKSDQST